VIQKGLRDIFILAGALVAVFSVYFIFRPDQRVKLHNIVNDPTGKVEQRIIYDKKCAQAGEEPVSNFDLRTGKIDERNTVVNCCPGLKEIQKKQTETISRDKSGEIICGMKVGAPNSTCSPCGNGKCDTSYEDVCNCPEDCKK